MAGKGGAREGAGRPAGSVNRKSVELLAGLADGLSPVAYMLSILRDENADTKDRAWAAEKAAPFFHAKPAPLPRLVALELPKTDTAEGISAAIAKIIEATGAGLIAPSEAQSLVAVIEGQRRAVETATLLERMEALERFRDETEGKR